MIDSQTVAFALAAAVLTVTPGQDTMLVVRNVLRGGRGDGVVTTLGICSGLFMHATLSALGMSVILMQSAAAFQAVKYAGRATSRGSACARWRAPCVRTPVDRMLRPCAPTRPGAALLSRRPAE